MASSAASTATATTTPAPAALRNPKDSMKQTWRSDKSSWTWYHYMMDMVQVHQHSPIESIPVHAKTDKIPFLPQYEVHKYILFYSAVPLILHQALVYFFGRNMTTLEAFGFYSVAFKLLGIRHFHQLRKLGRVYGYLDGDKHQRDDVPDHSVLQVWLSLISTSTFRSIFTVMLTYNSKFAPIDLDWRWLPLEIGLYGILLDFWFYWYHRVMHEFDGLWRFHRTHHLTKHPNALLTLYADHEQEFFDIAGIPLLAYGTLKLFGVPMGFYEWWICHQYVMFTELSGHSGIRFHGGPPSTLSWPLSWVGGELVIEDHDLHHRRGWKKSGNYGKQTRLWDMIFGTCLDRIESKKDNIDYVNTAKFPIF